MWGLTFQKCAWAMRYAVVKNSKIILTTAASLMPSSKKSKNVHVLCYAVHIKGTPSKWSKLIHSPLQWHLFLHPPFVPSCTPGVRY